MAKKRQIDIPPMSARAFTVEQGETVRIVDVEGGQPGDLVAFNLHDLSEHFSQSRTRVENHTCSVTTGHRLWTNTLPPKIMFTITEDSAGDHDLLYTPCCRYALETRFKLSRDGCHEHLAKALAPWNISLQEIPDPLNLFFSVNVESDGTLSIGKHRSLPGDYIELRAEMDCLAAISTCSVPLEEKSNSGFTIEISKAGFPR